MKKQLKELTSGQLQQVAGGGVQPQPSIVVGTSPVLKLPPVLLQPQPQPW